MSLPCPSHSLGLLLLCVLLLGGTPLATTRHVDTKDTPNALLSWEQESAEDDKSGLDTPNAILSSDSSADPCSAVHANLIAAENSTGFGFVKPSEMVACTRSIPFNTTSAFEDLDSVIVYFENFYGLLHLARNWTTHEGYYVQHDVIGALRGLKFQKWNSTEEFYQAMEVAVQSLQDAHTRIDLPTPAQYILALYLGFDPDNITTIRVDSFPQLCDAFKSNFNCTAMKGATVVSIEGQDAYTYIKQWVQSNRGITGRLNPGQWMNAVFPRFYVNITSGQRVSYSGPFNGRTHYPGVNSLTMELLLPGASSSMTVQVPWLATTIADLDAFANSSALATVWMKKMPSAAPAQDRIQHPMLMIPQPVHSRASLPRRKEHLSNLTQGVLVSGNSYFQVYQLNDNKTRVLVFPTFELPPTVDASEITTALALANQSSQVIIDLSGNGGGKIGLAYALVQLLVGPGTFGPESGRNASYDFIHFRSDMNLVRNMQQQGTGRFNVTTFFDPTTEVRYNTSMQSSYLSPFEYISYGSNGYYGSYSSAFKSDIVNLYSVSGSNVSGSEVPVGPSFGSKPFLLLSDGLCYSACNTFSYILARKYGAPLVTYGGLPWAYTAFAAGGGGFVSMDMESDFYDGINKTAGVSREEKPKPFNIGIKLAMKIAPGSIKNDDHSIPMEFDKLSPEGYMNTTYGNVEDPTPIYLKAASFFTENIPIV